MILKKEEKNTNFVFSTKRGLLVGHEYKTTVDKTAWNSVQRRPTNNCGYLLLFIFHGGRSERVSKAPRVHRFDLASRLPVSSNDFLS